MIGVRSTRGGFGMLCVLAMAAIAVAALLGGLGGRLEAPNIDWSQHAQNNHVGVFSAIVAWMAAGNRPDCRICGDGTAICIAWDAGGTGQHGYVPLTASSGRWVAKTAFWGDQAYIKSQIDLHDCPNGYDSHADIVPAIDWEGEDE